MPHAHYTPSAIIPSNKGFVCKLVLRGALVTRSRCNIIIRVPDFVYLASIMCSLNSKYKQNKFSKIFSNGSFCSYLVNPLWFVRLKNKEKSQIVCVLHSQYSHSYASVNIISLGHIHLADITMPPVRDH